MAAIAAHVIDTYEQLAGERTEVGMSYQTTWGDGDDERSLAQALEEALERSRRADRDRRTTTVGPHRDEPLLFIGQRPARTLASQGEQRTLALSLRLAAFRARRRCHRRAAATCCWTTCSPNSTWDVPPPSGRHFLSHRYS